MRMSLENSVVLVRSVKRAPQSKQKVTRHCPILFLCLTDRVTRRPKRVSSVLARSSCVDNSCTESWTG
jgi:hypothetical protein